MWRAHASAQPPGWVYLVEPEGRLGPDDNGGRGPNYTARRALILNRAPLPQRMLDFEYTSFDGPADDFHAFLGDMINLRIAPSLERFERSNGAGFKPQREKAVEANTFISSALTGQGLRASHASFPGF